MAALEFVAPPGFEKWNRAMQGAYRKGWNAAMAGDFLCPYTDKRKSDGRLTWSRAFAATWNDGAAAAMSVRDFGPETTA